ncbi:MAG: hypothetical protein ACR2H2_06560 [Solirubrobacteraceae bacterium]
MSGPGPNGRRRRSTLVEALVDSGYDVWMETWRASKDVPNNTWTLDQAAVLDHPPAVRKILEQTGAESIQAVTHCQGSTSFVMPPAPACCRRCARSSPAR